MQIYWAKHELLKERKVGAKNHPNLTKNQAITSTYQREKEGHDKSKNTAKQLFYPSQAQSFRKTPLPGKESKVNFFFAF